MLFELMQQRELCAIKHKMDMATDDKTPVRFVKDYRSIPSLYVRRFVTAW